MAGNYHNPRPFYIILEPASYEVAQWRCCALVPLQSYQIGRRALLCPIAASDRSGRDRPLVSSGTSKPFVECYRRNRVPRCVSICYVA